MKSLPNPLNAARSRIMRAAKGSGNQTNEVALERANSAARLAFSGRYAVHPCQPEFIWLKTRLVLFVEGCFWYGCPWRYRASVHDRAYRRGKIITNRRLDQRLSRAPCAPGPSVIRIWERKLSVPSSLSILQRNQREA